MDSLVQDRIYKKVPLFDYQGRCPNGKNPYSAKGNSLKVRLLFRLSNCKFHVLSKMRYRPFNPLTGCCNGFGNWLLLGFLCGVQWSLELIHILKMMVGSMVIKSLYLLVQYIQKWGKICLIIICFRRLSSLWKLWRRWRFRKLSSCRWNAWSWIRYGSNYDGSLGCSTTWPTFNARSSRNESCFWNYRSSRTTFATFTTRWSYWSESLR